MLFKVSPFGGDLEGASCFVPRNGVFFLLSVLKYWESYFVIASVAWQSHRTSNELCLFNLHDEIATLRSQ
jgi:hypothetical protein